MSGLYHRIGLQNQGIKSLSFGWNFCAWNNILWIGILQHMRLSNTIRLSQGTYEYFYVFYWFSNFIVTVQISTGKEHEGSYGNREWAITPELYNPLLKSMKDMKPIIITGLY